MTTASVDAVLVTPDFPPALGGIQAVLWNTACAFSRVGITVVAPNHPEAPAFDARQPFAVRRVLSPMAMRRFRFATLTTTALGLLAHDRRRVLLCGHPFTSPTGLIAKRLFGTPFVVWAHAKELLAWQGVLRRCLPEADAVLVISSHTERLVESFGVRPDRMVMIPYAPDCAPAADAQVVLSPRRRPGPIILTVARLDELYKGHDVMLAALPLIAARFPDVQWVVVGDGPLRPYYQKLAHGRGLDRFVRFTGAVSRQERDAWFAACEVFAMLSRDRAVDGGAEGFGIVYLEANAFGKPVVAGRAGGAVDAVIDGTTGLLVDPENPIAVAATITRLLEAPDLARRLGEQGRIRIQEQLSWVHTASIVEDVLLRVRRR